MGNTWVQIVVSGTLGGVLVTVANRLLDKRIRGRARRVRVDAREAADAILDEAREVLDRANALHAQSEESRVAYVEDLRRSTLKSNYSMLASRVSNLSLCFDLLDLKVRLRDLEGLAPEYARFEELRDSSEQTYAQARARAVATSSGEAERDAAVSVLDAAEAASSTFHDAVAAWYRGLEEAGWPADRPKPADLKAAGAACLQAALDLSRLAAGDTPS